MNKTDFVDAVAAKAGLSKASAKAAVDAFISTVGDALKNGDKVILTGFGTFSVSERSAREGRNPSTGEVIKIPAKKVAKFKPGKELSEGIS
ncbi:HU family DNA-binding protein [Schleiferia thermophila]|uniref:DNA-binding protein HU-beta n=1 Tax=Schleiferia thermophila TaxID=884107 RepID=A0A369AB72_9FLAO|nr:HU family DNA-binding protein [Schleiferia thermophila]RCX05546.1 DNA-binding protein HU-beta [Schleiferia thermophila]GCD78960.1 DNA-binding protein HU-beta [Schleiferia thermophila]